MKFPIRKRLQNASIGCKEKNSKFISWLQKEKKRKKKNFFSCSRWVGGGIRNSSISHKMKFVDWKYCEIFRPSEGKYCKILLKKRDSKQTTSKYVFLKSTQKCPFWKQYACFFLIKGSLFENSVSLFLNSRWRFCSGVNTTLTPFFFFLWSKDINRSWLNTYSAHYCDRT